MKRKSNWLKNLLQWGTLAAIVGFVVYGLTLGEKPADVEAYCPFGGLQALGSYLVNNSLACTMSMTQIMVGVMLAVGVILFSKLFCGYLCPLGTVSEWMGRGGKKLKVSVEIRPGSIADRLLRAVKYALLFYVFYMSASSSELFCKNFDPYYAVATGFKGEITVWMTVISVALLFLGSFFVKMFWCKYICPLGALSNIFKFTLTFAGIVILLWALGLLGVASAWVWALGAACVIGYLWEMIYLKSKVFPLLRIVRDEATCTKCDVCRRKCPYSIDIKNLDKVKHIDCTLCGTCVSACPEDSLQVGGKRSLRWLPGILAVALFGAALWFGSHWELPTIDEKWGEYEQVEGMQTYEIEGLTSVKCFGSSKAFSAKMQKVPGVYGVKTFVKRHAVVISYDPKAIDETSIDKAIFSPTTMKFATPKAGVDSLSVVRIGVEGLHDKMDMVYFGAILRNIDGICGFDAQYDCPVAVTLYVDPSAAIPEKMLRDSIEVKEAHMLAHGGKVRAIPVHYELKSYDPAAGRIGRREFLDLMFEQTRDLSAPFKHNTETYGDDAKYPKGVYEVECRGIEKPLIKRSFPYFRGFLSLKEGITRLDVALNDEEVPVLRIVYVKSMWDDAKIWNELLNAKVWPVKYKDGTLKDEEPKFTFKTEGHTQAPFFEINQEDDEKSDFLPAGLRPAPGCGVGRRRHVAGQHVPGRDLPPDEEGGAETQTRRDLQRGVPGAVQRHRGRRRRHGHGQRDFGQGTRHHQPPCGLRRHPLVEHPREELPRRGLLGARTKGRTAAQGQDRDLPAAGPRRDGRGPGHPRLARKGQQPGHLRDAQGLRHPRTEVRQGHPLRSGVRLDVEGQEIPAFLLRDL